MAKHKLSKANQKLYFASIHFDAIRQAEKNDALMNQKAIVRANMESALFHMVAAYRSFIWEVCNTHDVDTDYELNLDQVIEKSKQEGKQIQELNHFAHLESQPDSWLAGLLNAYSKAVSLDPDENTQVNSVASFNAIEVRKVDDFENPEKIFEWHNALKTEIESFRETLSEW